MNKTYSHNITGLSFYILTKKQLRKRSLSNPLGYKVLVYTGGSNYTAFKSIMAFRRWIRFLGLKILSLNNRSGTLSDYTETNTFWTNKELAEFIKSKKLKQIFWLDNGDYVIAGSDTVNNVVYYQNPNVKDRTVLNYRLFADM